MNNNTNNNNNSHIILLVWDCTEGLDEDYEAWANEAAERYEEEADFFACCGDYNGPQGK